MYEWKEERCPGCDGDRAFDTSDPGGPTVPKMEPCGECSGKGIPCCQMEVGPKHRPCGCNAVMRAVVHGKDEDVNKARDLYLCDDCADQANLDGRLAQVLTSAYSTSGQHIGDDEREVAYHDIRVRGAHAHVVAKEGGCVGVEYESISTMAARYLLNLGPNMAIELGSRLIQAGQFAARKRKGNA